DCDDKGKKTELTVKPLLVSKADLEEFGGGSPDYEINELPDLALRRFNVPFNDLKTPTEILNAFHSAVDAQVLNKISSAYIEAYNTFKPILGGTNLFNDLNSKLTAHLSKVKSSQVLFTQYFYDFIEDLIK